MSFRKAFTALVAMGFSNQEAFALAFKYSR